MREQCTICGHALKAQHRDVLDPLSGEHFEILRCTGCGLGHTAPRPAEPGRYYTRRYYGNRHSFTLRYCLSRRLSFVSAILGQGDGRQLLDIGCGDGSFLAAARDKGWLVMGTELNPEAARDRGFQVLSDISQLPPTATFQCITMWHTLEHMPEILPVLRKVRQLLAVDGRIIISVPDLGSLPARLFRSRWLHLDVPRHLYHFDNQALTGCLAAAGFEVVRRWHHELEYDLMGWVQSFLNYLLPTPNLFFDLITGKPATAGMLQQGVALLLGVALTILSLPALVAGILMKRGGTLIIVARPRQQSAEELTS